MATLPAANLLPGVSGGRFIAELRQLALQQNSCFWKSRFRSAAFDNEPSHVQAADGVEVDGCGASIGLAERSTSFSIAFAAERSNSRAVAGDLALIQWLIDAYLLAAAGGISAAATAAAIFDAARPLTNGGSWGRGARADAVALAASAGAAACACAQSTWPLSASPWSDSSSLLQSMPIKGSVLFGSQALLCFVDNAVELLTRTLDPGAAGAASGAVRVPSALAAATAAAGKRNSSGAAGSRFDAKTRGGGHDGRVHSNATGDDSNGHEQQDAGQESAAPLPFASASEAEAIVGVAQSLVSMLTNAILPVVAMAELAVADISLLARQNSSSFAPIPTAAPLLLPAMMAIRGLRHRIGSAFFLECGAGTAPAVRGLQGAMPRQPVSRLAAAAATVMPMVSVSGAAAGGVLGGESSKLMPVATSLQECVCAFLTSWNGLWRLMQVLPQKQCADIMRSLVSLQLSVSSAPCFAGCSFHGELSACVQRACSVRAV